MMLALPAPVARVLNTQTKRRVAAGALVLGYLFYTGKIKVWRLGRKKR